MPRPTEMMISAAVKSTARVASRKGTSGFAGSGWHPAWTECSQTEDPLSNASARQAPARSDAKMVPPPLARTSPFNCLEELANERDCGSFGRRGDHVADQYLPKTRRQFGCKIADLIGVRKQN